MKKHKEEITDSFHKALKEFHMLDGRCSVLVGFSGGADSTLLLSLLSEQHDLTVYAAHLNHGIRGTEAERDEQFCRSFCEENSIPLFVRRLDIPLLSQMRGTGLEETARTERYAFFQSLCAEHSIDSIATAHNASDNAETILFHLIRGCGPDGLCGIPPVRENIIRPLIYCTKDQILAYCRENGIVYVTDSTNADTAYTRNYLRHEILPRMKALNPSLEISFSSLASLMREDKDYFGKVAENYTFSSGRRALAGLEDSLLGRVLLRELRNNGLSPQKLHVRLATDAIRSSAPRITLSIPGGSLICDRDTVYTDTPKLKKEALPGTVLSDGLTLLSEDSAVFLAVSAQDFSKDINKLKNIYKLSIHISVDSAKIMEVIYLRGKLPGDRYTYGGMTRKVKKLLQSKKLTAEERQTLPLFLTGEEIIWIPGFPPADSVKPTSESETTELWFFKGKETS